MGANPFLKNLFYQDYPPDRSFEWYEVICLLYSRAISGLRLQQQRACHHYNSMRSSANRYDPLRVWFHFQSQDPGSILNFLLTPPINFLSDANARPGAFLLFQALSIYTV